VSVALSSDRAFRKGDILSGDYPARRDFTHDFVDETVFELDGVDLIRLIILSETTAGFSCSY
jgi:hypothetical protein